MCTGMSSFRPGLGQADQAVELLHQLVHLASQEPGCFEAISGELWSKLLIQSLVAINKDRIKPPSNPLIRSFDHCSCGKSVGHEDAVYVSHAWMHTLYYIALHYITLHYIT